MYIEELLEVAIGLVFMWLVLALACMGVQEWLAGWLKFRSRDLEDAIRRMLQEPPVQEPSESASVLDRLKAWLGALFGGTSKNLSAQGQLEVDNGLATKFYDHPLIKALSKPGGRPSYIPDRTFALALFDIMMTAGTEASVLNTWNKKLEALETSNEEQKQAVQTALLGLVEVAKTATSDEDKQRLPKRLKKEADLVKAKLKTKYPDLEPVFGELLSEETIAKLLDEFLNDTTLAHISRGVAKYAVENPNVAGALNSLIVGAEAYLKEGENTLAAARTNVETWFNDTMARLTGVYKRRAQVIGVTFGVFFAFVLNVDTVTIATTLWREPTIRQALVAQAENFKFPDETEGVDPATAIEEFSERFEGLHPPIGWKQIELEIELKSGTRRIRCITPVDAPEDKPLGQWIWSKILGWGISGAAASMGAPFWFDVLKKLTNVRSSGKNPAEEKPKKED